MTAIGERHRELFYLYKQTEKQIRNRCYIQKARHFSKSKTISVTFWYTESRTLDLTRFFMKFWSWHLYSKSMTLCITWLFYIEKGTHFAKSKTICLTFLYTTIRTLYVTRFLLNFWNWRRGGHFYLQKTMNFVLHF